MFLKTKYKIVEIIVPYLHIFEVKLFIRTYNKNEMFQLCSVNTIIMYIIVYIILVLYLCRINMTSFMNKLKQLFLLKKIYLLQLSSLSEYNMT